MKKAIYYLFITGLCIGLTACSSVQTAGTDIIQSDNTSTLSRGTDKMTFHDIDDIAVGDEDTSAPAVNGKTTYPLSSNTTGVKLLGVRNEPSENYISCDWSCSGFEMNVNSFERGDIVFHASAGANCYFRAYVDGSDWGKYYVVGVDLCEIVLENVPAGIHTIRLIKVTGHTLACAQVTDVCFAGSISETSPAQKELYIEFIGDSICCGWGMIGSKDGQYTGQDGSLAYPYLVAEAMNADYSITALSGQGLLMGDPGMTKGYLMISPKRSASIYNFERTADVVVINVGTNDYYYHLFRRLSFVESIIL